MRKKEELPGIPSFPYSWKSRAGYLWGNNDKENGVEEGQNHRNVTVSQWEKEEKYVHPFYNLTALGARLLNSEL